MSYIAGGRRDSLEGLSSLIRPDRAPTCQVHCGKSHFELFVLWFVKEAVYFEFYTYIGALPE